MWYKQNKLSSVEALFINLCGNRKNHKKRTFYRKILWEKMMIDLKESDFLCQKRKNFVTKLSGQILKILSSFCANHHQWHQVKNIIFLFFLYKIFTSLIESMHWWCLCCVPFVWTVFFFQILYLLVLKSLCISISLSYANFTKA